MPVSNAACSPASWTRWFTNDSALPNISSMRAGMDAPVGDEVLHGDAADLAAHRVEARDGDALRRVVDDEVGPGQLLERADVASFAADDAAFQVVRGDMDGGRRCSRPNGRPRRAGWPGSGSCATSCRPLPSPALSASRMIAADSCATWSFKAVEQFGLRLVGRHAGHALEATRPPPSRRRPGHARGARSAPAWTRSDALAHRATRHGGRATPRVEITRFSAARTSRSRSLFSASASCLYFRAWSFASMSASRRNVSACRFASATTLSASCAARFVDALTKNRAMTKPRATPTTAPMTSHNASGIRSPFHDGCSVKQ